MAAHSTTHRLSLSSAAREAIRGHAARTAPLECCGALLGRDNAAGRVVLAALPVPNDSERPQCAFEIPADAVRRVERDAQLRGLELVGFYHSHPDASAHPSPSDLANAWPWYTYLIVSGDGELRAWRLREARDGFDPQPIASDAA